MHKLYGGPLSAKYQTFGNAVADQMAHLAADVKYLTDQQHGMHMQLGRMTKQMRAEAAANRELTSKCEEYVNIINTLKVEMAEMRAFMENAIYKLM
jgi:hypothetical protein